jgi:predicted transposase YbfD/YdcC
MDILSLLESIEDPREDGRVKYDLSMLIFSTFCAVLCGVETWSDIPLFCASKIGFLSKYVNFSNGIPSEWTFRRVFTLLDPSVLEWFLREHASNLINGGVAKEQIAIDGKALRSSGRHNLSSLHMVSAFCHERGLILAETNVSDKSNEITAIPLLLEVLNIKDNTVTIDAAGCQKNIADLIINKKGNYVLALKKNHPKFYEKVSNHCQSNGIKSENCLKDSFDDGHGRTVRRRYFACDISNFEESQEWNSLKSAVAVETISSAKHSKDGVTSNWRYYISNLLASKENLPDLIRNHWSIENKLHWVLDVNLKEDDDRKSERKSAKAFAVLRRIALNVVRIKGDRGYKNRNSLRSMIRSAGWNNDNLLKLLV